MTIEPEKLIEEIYEKKPQVLKSRQIGLREKVSKWIKKDRTTDEILELTLYLALASLFIGCWITVHIGVSFLILGAVLLAIVHRATATNTRQE